MRSHLLLGTGKSKLSSNRVMRSMLSLLPIQRRGLGYKRKEFKPMEGEGKVKKYSKVKPLKFKF